MNDTRVGVAHDGQPSCTQRFRLEISCDQYEHLLCKAYDLLNEHTDIIEDWIHLLKGPTSTGDALFRRVTGDTRTVFQCGGLHCELGEWDARELDAGRPSEMPIVVGIYNAIAAANAPYATGYPPGIMICDWYLDWLQDAWARETNELARECLILDLAAVILHETFHLTGHPSEGTAWALEWYFRFHVAQARGLRIVDSDGSVWNARYCCTNESVPPISSFWTKDAASSAIREADNWSASSPCCFDSVGNAVLC